MAALISIPEKDPRSILIVLPVVLVGWYIVSSILAWRRLRHIPGPFLASFSHLWMGTTSYSGKLEKIFLEFEGKYGKLARVGPNDLITSDPEIIRRMGASKSTYNKDSSYEGNRFNPYHPTMFIMLETQRHDEMKARLTPGYSGRDVPRYETAVDEQLDKMIGLIRRKYVSEPEKGKFRDFSLTKPLTYFPLDVIFCLSVSKHVDEDPGCCDLDDDPYGFYPALEDHLPHLALTTDIPWMRRILYSPLFLKWFGPKETDLKGMGALMKLTNAIVRQRFNERNSGNEKQHNDMLQSFMDHGLNQTECEVETLFMFIAGSDTTASTLKITMMYILSTPRVYQRLKSEIATALREGDISKPITLSEAKRLPYLQAVIYEGLRIRPVTMGALRKQVPPQGDTIHGHFIPGGTTIGSNTTGILRSKEIFGLDANTFRPERFLGLDEGKLAEMRRSVEMTFGYGRWMCAGKPIAFMELNKVYFELFRYFDFQLLDPERPMVSEGYVLFRDRGLHVRATEARDME
ncbi:Pisatin demethylase [Cytospora mali]|uniref:Pisatin demethylase n=1 Tax=Cytospora mali TaxID=578113 RepID=A0A194V619_CYTMA|nr:Pisatin demethylase [Valsa mali var. pyri (nom. inval.)]